MIQQTGLNGFVVRDTCSYTVRTLTLIRVRSGPLLSLQRTSFNALQSVTCINYSSESLKIWHAALGLS